MKAMMLGFLAIALIALGSNIVLNNAGFSTAEHTASSSVRLD